MHRILVFLVLLIASPTFGQKIVDLAHDKSIRINGQTLSSGWSQGINSAQIQTLDLNGDGREEWVIWDINARQLQVFEKKGADFHYRPELAYFFPTDISGFLVLADFDRDGKKDLFTSSPLGIRAYRNTSTATQISWALAQNFLRLEGANNIPANNLDTPLLQDLDGDGDLDLLLFNFAVGDYLEYYRNTSVERKGSADIDGFAFPVRHWGKFEFCGCGQIRFGQTCDGRSLAEEAFPGDQARVQHAGGHSMLYRDFTGDGVPDLLIGREECNTLYFLPNGGTASSPIFSSFSNQLPGYGSLPNFPRFHAGQLLGDTLLVSLNTNEMAAPYRIDFANSLVGVEKNTGLTRPLLQNQLLDLGENTRPFFTGTAFSGELLLTANSKKRDKIVGQAFQMRYTGTQLELMKADYLDLSSLDLQDLSLLAYTAVSKQRFLFAVGTRTGTTGLLSPVLLLQEGAAWQSFSLAGLTLRLGDQLLFFAYQGKDYLLVAAQSGSLTRYELDLTARSVSAATPNFLGFQDNPATRNLNIAIRATERPDLYTVDQRGRIFRIKDFMSSAVQEEVLVRIQEQNLPLRLGRSTWIAVVDAGLGREEDLLVGTRGGGLIYLSASAEGSTEEGDFLVNAYPNPNSGTFRVVSSQSGTARLLSPLGQIVLEDIPVSARSEVVFELPGLSAGLYFLQLQAEDGRLLVKKIWVN